MRAAAMSPDQILEASSPAVAEAIVKINSELARGDRFAFVKPGIAEIVKAHYEAAGWAVQIQMDGDSPSASAILRFEVGQ